MLPLLNLARRSSILPFIMRSMIAVLIEMAGVDIVRVMSWCLHCMAHDDERLYQAPERKQMVEWYGESLTDANP